MPASLASLFLGHIDANGAYGFAHGSFDVIDDRRAHRTEIHVLGQDIRLAGRIQRLEADVDVERRQPLSPAITILSMIAPQSSEEQAGESGELLALYTSTARVRYRISSALYTFTNEGTTS